MTAVLEGRVARARRERLLGQFVDRSAEMAMFARVLESADMPIMVVSGEAGMGKTSLMMRMLHECALQGVMKAELEWSSLDVLDYSTVLRKLRDSLGVEPFTSFTDLINYYTDANYTPTLDININVVGGIHVAEGAQISGSTVGDIAGVVLRDNMFVVQRADISVPMEVRREQLTQRFLQGLATLSADRKVALFFGVTEKMTDITYQWLWEQLLKPVVDGALPNVRAILLGQRTLLPDRDLAAFVVHAPLKPLAVEDIDLYIAKRAAGVVTINDETRRELAKLLSVMTRGRPADVSSAVDLYIASNPGT